MTFHAVKTRDLLPHVVLLEEESHLSQNASQGHPSTPHTHLLQQQAANGGAHLGWGAGFCWPLLFLRSGCESFQNETHGHN